MWKQRVDIMYLNGKIEFHIQKLDINPTRINYQSSKNNFTTVDRSAYRRLI